MLRSAAGPDRQASEPEGARYVAEHSEVVARYTEWG
jgi:hypothetical protein